MTDTASFYTVQLEVHFNIAQGEYRCVRYTQQFQNCNMHEIVTKSDLLNYNNCISRYDIILESIMTQVQRNPTSISVL